MVNPSKILIQEFDYDLPNDRIAFFPLAERDDSKLLCYEDKKISIAKFRDLAAYLPAGSLLVLNNTRVIEARILFQKTTGGTIEIFCLEPERRYVIDEALNATSATRWICYIGGASKWKHGELLTKEIDIGGNTVQLTARFIAKNEDSFTIEFSWNPPQVTFAEVLHAAGSVPLPPYIKRMADPTDAQRYQTIFAENQGSVAAPTAALHFTQQVFDDLQNKNINASYVTLHVGAGTFKPVKSDTIAEHSMHAERFEVSLTTLIELKNAQELIAVGTTSLRTMESLYWIGVKIAKGLLKPGEEIRLGQWEAYQLSSENISYQDSIQAIIYFLNNTNSNILYCETSLLIVPGYGFKSARALITNFHQPRSTLLLLVAAFIGDDWKTVYEFALKNDFRFLSYGDSSLLWRKD